MSRKSTKKFQNLLILVIGIAFGLVALVLLYKAATSTTPETRSRAATYVGCTGAPPPGGCTAASPYAITSCTGMSESNCIAAAGCGCVPYYGPINCQTTQKWYGTCTLQSDCRYMDAGVAWDPNVTTCKIAGPPNYGCCGDQSRYAGKSCTTTLNHWKGTCKRQNDCTATGYIWDTSSVSCGGNGLPAVLEFGCCAKHS